MTVRDVLTDIADTIRNNSDVRGTMKLEDMPNGILAVHRDGEEFGKNIGYNDGFTAGTGAGYETGLNEGLDQGRQEGFIEGKASVQEVHKITIAEDNAGSTAVATWWLTNNEFVKNHYADEGFTLQLISLQAHAEGDALCYAYNGNRQMMDLGENNVCGFRFSRTTTNTTNVATVNGNCLSGGYTGIPYVKTDGTVVSIHRSGNTALKAGDYLLVLSVAEV